MIFDSHTFDNLARSLAAHLAATLGPTDGQHVAPGRRAGLVTSRPAVGIAWTRWVPSRTQWRETRPDVTLRIYCYTEKHADEQDDHREEGRFHLAVLTALTDQGTVPCFDYRQDPPSPIGDVRLDWVGGENPPEAQSRSRSETHFDVIARFDT